MTIRTKLRLRAKYRKLRRNKKAIVAWAAAGAAAVWAGFRLKHRLQA